jgi:hypothetical protein
MRYAAKEMKPIMANETATFNPTHCCAFGTAPCDLLMELLAAEPVVVGEPVALAVAVPVAAAVDSAGSGE